MSESVEVGKAGAEGQYFVRRLEAIRTYFKLNPPDADASDDSATIEVIRAVCSDGLV